jgi:hypothetical protein
MGERNTNELSWALPSHSCQRGHICLGTCLSDLTKLLVLVHILQ